MKMLITNLEGQCLFDVSIETQAEGLITLHEGKHKKTDLEDYLKGGEIKIESTDPCEACEKIAEIIKGAKKHGEVFIAFDGRGLGPLLNFVANHVGVDGIIYMLQDQSCQNSDPYTRICLQRRSRFLIIWLTEI